jgi:hypothetical protein
VVSTLSPSNLTFPGIAPKVHTRWAIPSSGKDCISRIALRVCPSRHLSPKTKTWRGASVRSATRDRGVRPPPSLQRISQSHLQYSKAYLRLYTWHFNVIHWLPTDDTPSRSSLVRTPWSERNASPVVLVWNFVCEWPFYIYSIYHVCILYEYYMMTTS